MVRRLLSFCKGRFSRAMLVLIREVMSGKPSNGISHFTFFNRTYIFKGSISIASLPECMIKDMGSIGFQFVESLQECSTKFSHQRIVR